MFYLLSLRAKCWVRGGVGWGVSQKRGMIDNFIGKLFSAACRIGGGYNELCPVWMSQRALVVTTNQRIANQKEVSLLNFRTKRSVSTNDQLYQKYLNIFIHSLLGWSNDDNL